MAKHFAHVSRAIIQFSTPLSEALDPPLQVSSNSAVLKVKQFNIALLSMKPSNVQCICDMGPLMSLAIEWCPHSCNTGIKCDPLWKNRPLALKYDFAVGGSILYSTLFFRIFFLWIF